MKTSIYKPKLISQILLIVFAFCISVVVIFVFPPRSWVNIVFPLIPIALIIVRSLRDRIELNDYYILNRNSYMNMEIALDKIEDIQYINHWYGDSAVITFRNKFDVVNTMNIACEYDVEEIVEEIHSRKSR